MDFDLFTLFKSYHDKSLDKFKKELLDDFIKIFNTTKNSENENYISNTKTHICGYKRSHKSDVYDIHEVGVSRKHKNQTVKL